MTNNNGNGLEHRRAEVQQAVKSACDMLNADGVAPRDYVEQLAWLFFLKAFDETEARLEEEGQFEGNDYARRLSGPLELRLDEKESIHISCRWADWSQLTEKPDVMLRFVNGPLWDRLLRLHDDDKLNETDQVAQQFNRIFSTVKNHSRRGANFARVVQQVNRLHFSDATDVIVLSEIYEGLLKQVAADSAGYAGEFYTQRHIIRAMVEVVRPQLGDRIYDPCFGTAGFLGDAADFLRNPSRNPAAKKLGARDLDRLQTETFYGVEKKALTFLLGIMNMLLHDIEGANLELGDTLERHSQNVPEKNKYTVILANPPYGGKLTREVQTNFTIRSASTEILFVQHIMANLAKGGRAAVIVPEGVLFRGGPDARVRKRLVEEFKVHTVLSLPAGCFLPYTGVKTNVIFFDRPKDGSPQTGNRHRCCRRRRRSTVAHSVGASMRSSEPGHRNPGHATRYSVCIQTDIRPIGSRTVRG